MFPIGIKLKFLILMTLLALIAFACYIPRYGQPVQVLPAASDDATASPSATAQLVPGTGCIPARAPEQARLVSVIDGDTIVVTLANNDKRYHVRLIGIDTPEVYPVKEYFGQEATEYNKRLLKDADTVYLFRDVSDVDQYGRMLRYVVANGSFINYELVKNGYAHAYTYPPDVACLDSFLKIQRQARTSRTGLWSATPTP